MHGVEKANVYLAMELRGRRIPCLLDTGESVGESVALLVARRTNSQPAIGRLRGSRPTKVVCIIAWRYADAFQRSTP